MDINNRSMGKKDKPKFMKSKHTTAEESKYSYDALSSGNSIQYTDNSDDHIVAGSLTSDSSADSTPQMYGLPLHRAVVVVANAALGAGMLNFPQAYDKSGGLVNALTVQTVSNRFQHQSIGEGFQVCVCVLGGVGGILTHSELLRWL